MGKPRVHTLCSMIASFEGETKMDFSVGPEVAVRACGALTCQQ